MSAKHILRCGFILGVSLPALLLWPGNAMACYYCETSGGCAVSQTGPGANQCYTYQDQYGNWQCHTEGECDKILPKSLAVHSDQVENPIEVVSVTSMWRTDDGRYAVHLTDGSWALQASAGQWVRLTKTGDREYRKRSWSCEHAVGAPIALQPLAPPMVAAGAMSDD